MSDPQPQIAPATEAAQRLGIDRLRRHIFLCIGKPAPTPNAAGKIDLGCCKNDVGLASWNHLKKRLAELGLSNPAGPVARSKVECLRLCCEGPTGVVYPEGTWYRNLTPTNLDRVIGEHLQNGRIVEDLVIAQKPLE